MEGLVTAPPLRLRLPSSTPIWPEALGVLYGSLWISVLKGNGAWLDTAQVRLQVWLPSPRLLDMSALLYVPNLYVLNAANHFLGLSSHRSRRCRGF